MQRGKEKMKRGRDRKPPLIGSSLNRRWVGLFRCGEMQVVVVVRTAAICRVAAVSLFSPPLIS
jgi:hypothetical protein